jgi:hypothetical protein
MENLMNLPLWQLSVAQFLDVLNAANKKNTPKPSAPKELLYGLRGIEQLFGVSHATAQKWKDGCLRGAVSQRGRKIVIDKAEALRLFDEYATKAGKR